MVRLRCHCRKMDPFGNDEIARLLRLKRYEQPPPDYFENFLHEFRRRQRDQLLRQPPWRMCFEHAQDFVVQCNVRSLASYAAGIVAMLACAAVISITIYQQPDTTQFAVQSSSVPTRSPNTDKELDRRQRLQNRPPAGKSGLLTGLEASLLIVNVPSA